MSDGAGTPPPLVPADDASAPARARASASAAALALAAFSDDADAARRASSLDIAIADAARHWTEDAQASAADMARRAEGFAWMHARQGAAARRWQARLAFAGGLVSGAAASLSTAAASFGELEAMRALAIATAALTFAGAAVAVYVRAWDPAAAAAAAHAAELAYGSLCGDLVYQTSLARADRADAREYLRAKNAEYRAIADAAPPIEDETWAALRRDKPTNPLNN